MFGRCSNEKVSNKAITAAVSFTEALSKSYARIIVKHPHCCSWASSGKSQRHNQCNWNIRVVLMFVFQRALSSRRRSFTDLLQLHFTLLSFGQFLFTFLLISSCFSPLRDSCMLIHWIAQLTHFFASCPHHAVVENAATECFSEIEYY